MLPSKWMESKDYRFTVGYTYYNEPELLKNQLEFWLRYPHEVEIILVDDGSQKYPAYEILKDLDIPNFQLWQVDEDLGFNSHGCRNLITKLASTDYILFMDIDCLMSPDNMGFLKKIKFKENNLYRFAMMNGVTKKYFSWPGHHNVFLVNKETFWAAGGYDESFTGYHKGDREFHRRLEAITKQSKVSDSVGITVVRGGRKSIIDEEVDKATYDDEEMLIRLPQPSPKEVDLVGKVKTKINFSYTRLL